MDTLISIIGGANMDMSATLNGAFIAADSNPGHIEVGYGGVARNIAHNLALLGARTQLLTVFGGDLFGGLMHDYCKQQGIDVHLSERESSQRSGIYLCLHNQGGEMIAAVADTEAIRLITPEWLAKRIGEINMSEFIVADTNVTQHIHSDIINRRIDLTFQFGEYSPLGLLGCRDGQIEVRLIDSDCYFHCRQY